MALVTCSECGKSISDKAAACPGCGCPAEASKTTPSMQQLDLTGQSAKDLWLKVSYLNSNINSHDTPNTVKICKFIIDNYGNSPEATLAKGLLNSLNVKWQATSSIHVNSEIKSNDSVDSCTESKISTQRQYTSTQIKKSQWYGRITIAIILLALAGGIIASISSRSNISIGGFFTSPKTVLKRHLGNYNLEVVEAAGIESCYWFDDNNHNLNNRTSGFAKIQNGKVINLNYYYTNLKVGAIETCQGREYVSPIDDIFSGR